MHVHIIGFSITIMFCNVFFVIHVRQFPIIFQYWYIIITVFIRILSMIQFNIRNLMLGIFINPIIRKVGKRNYFR